MIKMRTRIGSIVLAVAMLLTLLPVTAFADGTDQTVSPVQVDSFEKLQNAQTAVEGSIIEVSGNITMEQPGDLYEQGHFETDRDRKYHLYQR